MKILKSLFALFAFLGFFVSVPAFAADINDVSESYWANAEIAEMVSKDVMQLDE